MRPEIITITMYIIQTVFHIGMTATLVRGIPMSSLYAASMTLDQLVVNKPCSQSQFH